MAIRSSIAHTAKLFLRISSANCFLGGLDECRRKRDNDSIAIHAKASHTGGIPINQRECAGFNWPILFVAAPDPVGIGPETAPRTSRCKSRELRFAADISLRSPAVPSCA